MLNLDKFDKRFIWRKGFLLEIINEAMKIIDNIPEAIKKRATLSFNPVVYKNSPQVFYLSHFFLFKFNGFNGEKHSGHIYS